MLQRDNLLEMGFWGRIALRKSYINSNDLNDLDLDTLANSIVADVLSVYCAHSNGLSSIMQREDVPELLPEKLTVKNGGLHHHPHEDYENKTVFSKTRQSIPLAFRLNDSHQRYVNVSSIWKKGVIGPMRDISDRLSGRCRECAWRAKGFAFF